MNIIIYSLFILSWFMFVNDPESDVGGGEGGSGECPSAAAAVDDDVEKEEHAGG